MLLAASALKGYAIEASDGRIGSVSDFLIEDNTWKIRWLVDDTGTWLVERKLLVSPLAIRKTELDHNVLHLNLTKEQVEASPEISSDEPVSRRKEHDLYGFYGWDPYWAVSDAGFIGSPAPFAAAAASDAMSRAPADAGDPHLRSSTEMIGYHIRAADGEIGHLANVLVDDSAWQIEYLVVSDRNWLPGKHLLILPETVREISWAEGLIRIDLNREQVEASPPWNQADLIDPGYQEKMHGHFSRANPNHLS